MFISLAFAVACMAGKHPPIHHVGILAGRATVVLADEAWSYTIPKLDAANCTGAGQAIVTSVDLVSPWQRACLCFPSHFADRPLYPNRPPLRASYSPFGIFVVDYAATPPTSDLEPSIYGLTLPQLESKNISLRYAIKNNTPLTNEILERGLVHLKLDPLYRRGGGGGCTTTSSSARRPSASFISPTHAAV